MGMEMNLLPLTNKENIPAVHFFGSTLQTVRLYNLTTDYDPESSGFLCNVKIRNPQVKFINTGLSIYCYNLFIYENLDLAGNSWTILGKILYKDGFSTSKKILNSKPLSGRLMIGNLPSFSNDDDLQWIYIEKLRYFYCAPLVNDTIVLLSALTADTVIVFGYLNLLGQDLKIGSRTSHTGYLDCDLIVSTIAQGTVSLLGNSSHDPYYLVADSINNFILDNPAGVSLNNINALPTTHQSYGKMNLFGTATLTKGNFDLNESNLLIGPDVLFNVNSGRIIETTGSVFTSSVSSSGSYISKDTLVLTACSNMNVGGLGFIVTCNKTLYGFDIRRIPTVVTGVNGGSSINRVFAVANLNSGVNLNARIKLKYDDTELQGVNEGNLAIFRRSSDEPSNVWHLIPSTVNTSTNTVTAISGLAQLDYSVPGGETFYTLASVTSPLRNMYESNNQAILNSTKVLVYPNPFNNNFNVQFEARVAETATLQLIDLTGKQMHEESVQLAAGINDISLCCMEKLPAGVYFLRITSSVINSIVRVVKD